MIKTICPTCEKVTYRSPSKVWERNYCSRACYTKTRIEELMKHSEPFRLKPGNKRNPEWTRKQTEKVSGNKNYAWRGEDVGYRGLHQWIRRQKGKPTTCTKCGKFSEKPKVIQWANIDGKYHRNVDDFIAMCASCHKFHDLRLRSTRGGPSATR